MSRVCQFFNIKYSGHHSLQWREFVCLTFHDNFGKKQHLSSECLHYTPKNEQPLKNDGTET